MGSTKFIVGLYLILRVPILAGPFLVTSSPPPEEPTPPPFPELSVLRNAYPDLTFDPVYDHEQGDWRLVVSAGGRTGVFYRAGGRFLPPDRVGDQDRYRMLIYRYAEQIPDPGRFTEEDIERIVRFASPENRSSGRVTPTFFFDLVYDSASMEQVERHIVQVSFLGKKVKVHERIVEPLARIEAALLRLAEEDPETAGFIHTLEVVEGYSWRTIRDTSGRSFHSMGIALDLLPAGWQRKTLYWYWERNKGNDRWMLIPLSERWMPPLKVIEVFEAHGFIWGGKWPVWDNMHFEYRPELIEGRSLFTD
ncbi:M15 family metallopeptidase [Spirochaeta thermophila]|uniref:Peptidase M15C domain-containing protein n=1 Tax=Winmispira thermophila (strain ATCC 49972 / DSM 6192 / RI 19.B1) TaxID=665571 RepID=E0RSW1_WINT6|nr:M15 family metallopeptidase [Spirochaeta thermophila]ADN02098.1 hypothetical protein STHERM_c11560 [Spirochaeta thermophila DSM 6192]